MTEVTVSGWGVKLSFHPKLFRPHNWKLRRFELSKQDFRYSNENLAIKRVLSRSSVIFAESLELKDVPHWKSDSLLKHYPFAIRVWFGQEAFYFCVATENQQQKWIAAFNNQPSRKNLVSNTSAMSPMQRVVSIPPHKLAEFNSQLDAYNQ